MIRKIVTTFFIAALIGLFSFGDVQAQAEFDTGELGILLQDYGRFRVLTPDLSTDAIRQIDRMSVLVGVSPTEIFTYALDADNETDPTNITPASVGDFELFGAFNNAFSNEPPDVLVETSVYGWENESYVLIKYVVHNEENDAIDAAVGVELLPQINGGYGNETVEFLSDENIVQLHKESAHVGLKLLSDDLYTLHVIEWFSGYNDDRGEMYGYLTEGSIMDTYADDGEGTVVFIGQDKVNIPAGGSTEVYLAFAFADDEAGMIDAIATAKAEYDEVTSIVEYPGALPDKYVLEQNYPNPFNPATTINFGIPQSEHVTLTVYNLVGQKITTLVDEELTSGEYSVTFDASRLPSGVYFYTISAGSFQSTKQMMYLK